ncbi:hypothetical protein GCM10014719_33040 [Planomonospora parontospora subsp. antibiotica]|nr:hypothetical protein GCM10014719_33040 [Planomonospora parontospora subsp. antibiotica]
MSRWSSTTRTRTARSEVSGDTAPSAGADVPGPAGAPALSEMSGVAGVSEMFGVAGVTVRSAGGS